MIPSEPAEATGVPVRPKPRERLDPRARLLWRLNDLVLAIPLLGVAAAAAWVLTRLGQSWVLAAAPAVVGTILATLAIVVVPELRWRHWRYELDGDAVELQHGMLTVTRTLIPLPRIQHVETRRGPFQRRLGLASVVLHTAAGPHEIPALGVAVADALRDRIAALARAEEAD